MLRSRELARTFAKSLAFTSCLIIFVHPSFAQSPATLPSDQLSSTTQLLKKTPTPHRTPVSGVIEEMAVERLGNFDYDGEKGGVIPEDVAALDGTIIRLRGYMIPMDQAEKITQFALVGDVLSGPPKPPLIQQTIVVNVPQGKPTDYIAELISVEGKLHVLERKEDGVVVSIFDMDATSVRSLNPTTSSSPSSQLR